MIDINSIGKGQLIPGTLSKSSRNAAVDNSVRVNQAVYFGGPIWHIPELTVRLPSQLIMVGDL